MTTWQRESEIGRVKVPGGFIVVCMTRDGRGNRFADVRYWSGKGSEPRPTPRGCLVPIQNADRLGSVLYEAHKYGRLAESGSRS